MDSNEKRNHHQEFENNRITDVNEPNNMGTAGFVLSIVAIFATIFSPSSIILWILGIIFSIIGLSRKPKGLAIAGTIISCISAIVFVTMIVFAFEIIYFIK
ncbi:DUF4190 domain-containing protein [Apilactobacillus quenuiae]|uniref:DUF4190 domain-containing protein n=1 Tax=Apilactobacillus quenuiae TaxID=2008377 RepID=UPI000D018883|nr:DUF4190 domain-containing protein [Apilactobacillus quenuiae]